MMDKSLKRSQRILVGHGGLVLFWGCAVGYPFLFFLNGEVSLWPIPGKIDFQMPGTYDAWRMAHLEGIINGFGLWITAAILPIIPLTDVNLRRLAWAFVIVAWTIITASLIDPLFPDSRGLLFGGPATNILAFGLFLIGVPLITILAPYIAWVTLREKE
jgi:hypothetical protein